VNIGRDRGLAEERYGLLQIHGSKTVSLETSESAPSPNPNGSIAGLVKRFNPIGRQTLSFIESCEQRAVVAKHTIRRRNPHVSGPIL
jgi:hypothetical protein